MTTQPSTTKPWLIAAWPGMGNVAIIAATHLIQQLEMTKLAELPPGSHFDLIEVDVKQGLVEQIRLPRGIFFKQKAPVARRELIIFVGESQPAMGNYAYAHELLDTASKMGVERVVTFASLASGLHPSENPRVWGVATDPKTLDELRLAEVEPIAHGQIAGLNGLVHGIAVAHGLSGLCLLAEIPYFAMNIPNPKAARAALSVLAVLSGIDIRLEDLNRQAARIDRALIDAMEKATQQQQEASGDEAVGTEEDSAADRPTEPSHGDGDDAQEPSKLTPADLGRIGALFEDARKNPTHATKLKNELDRLGVFKDYEGQFLDLFRRAG